MSFIVCIEGPDAVGKTTQVLLLERRLKEHGYRVLFQEIPANGLIKKLIYKMLNNGLAKRFPTTFQIMHFINRLIWQYVYFPFLAKKYEIVILGRWSLSSLVYGTLEGVNGCLLEFLKSLLLNPHKTVILNGCKFSRDENDVYESDNVLQKKVQEKYDVISGNDIIKVSNVGKTPLEINDEIVSKLDILNIEQTYEEKI